MPKRKRNKRGSNSKSGYYGVLKRGNRYSARILIDGKYNHLGNYDTAKQAAKAHDDEAIKLRRPFCSMNYPKTAPVGYKPIQQQLQSNNTVGYRGATKVRGGRFQAQIQNGDKRQCLGTYDTPKEAAVAYDRALLKANKSTTLLNFPDMVHNLDVEPKRTRRKLSSSGYKGVCNTASGKFIARISIGNGKVKSLGTFNTAIQAALAYDQAAIKAGKKSHTLNFPDGLPIKEKEKEKESAKYKRSSSGYKGVGKSGKKFNVDITTKGKRTRLCGFDTAIQAALAYDQAAINAGRKQHTLNFPDGLPIIQKIGIKYV